MTNESTRKEEFKVSGEEVVAKIKELIKAGNIRRIILKNEKEETIMEIPLTFAVVGVVIAPVLAAVGAMAALLTKCVIVVERKEK
jgi:repressor of nif and glnA expression